MNRIYILVITLFTFGACGDGSTTALPDAGTDADTPSDTMDDTELPDADADTDDQPDSSGDGGDWQPFDGQWTRLSGPLPPQASSFVQHGDLLFMGTNFADQGAVFVSDNGGHSWTETGLPNGGVATMLSHEGRLFVGTYLSGLYWSDDDGSTWSHSGQPLASGTVEALLPLDADTIIAGSDLHFPSLLHRSDDNGLTWTAIESGPSLRCYDMDIVDGVLLAAGKDAALWRSTDGGDSWTQSTAGLPTEADTFAFAVDGTTVFLVAATNITPLVVYRSDDLGVNWSQVSSDLPPQAGRMASFLDIIDGELYLGTTGTSGARGLYRSSDNGITWTHLAGAAPVDPSVFAAILVDGDLLAGSLDGVYRSSFGATTWSPSWSGAGGIGGGAALVYAFDRLHVGLDRTSSHRNSIVSTEDLGLTWLAGIDSNTTARDFLFHEGAIYAAQYGIDRGVAVSHDGGDVYTDSSNGMDRNVVLNRLHAHQDVLFAGGFESLYRSIDAGATWELLPDIGSVNAFVSHGDFVYAGLYPGGVVRSDDSGETWTAINDGINPDDHINALVVHDDAVFAAINVGEVVRWNGTSWDGVGLGNEFVYDLLSVDGVLLAGTANEQIWIRIGDEDWTPFDEGYTGGLVISLAATPEYVVAGSGSHGIWIRSRDDLPTGE